MSGETEHIPIPAPSEAERKQLLSVIREISLFRGNFTLSSGAKSDYYMDLRLTSTDPEGAHLAARYLHHEAVRLRATHIGGPTLGADPLVGAGVTASYGTPWPVRGYIVRGATKQHGTGKRIEGHLTKNDRVVILDDVVTSAGSLLKAVDAVREAGAEIVGAWCLVDREGGGRERLAEAGIELTAVFQVGEVLEEIDSSMPRITTRGWRPRTPLTTVDAILELVPGHVLLIERKNQPLGWALPGGFVDDGESLEDAVRREVEEETALRIEKMVQMHTYSGPGRDPRFDVASTIFVATAHGDVEAGDDAVNAKLFPLDALPEGICFDHREILEDFRTGRHHVLPGHLH